MSIGHIRDKSGSQETKPNTLYFFDPTGENPYPTWEYLNSNGRPHVETNGGYNYAAFDGTTEPIKVTNQNHLIATMVNRQGFAYNGKAPSKLYTYILVGTTPHASDVAELGGLYYTNGEANKVGETDPTFDIDISAYKGKTLYMTLKASAVGGNGYAFLDLAKAYIQKI